MKKIFNIIKASALTLVLFSAVACEGELSTSDPTKVSGADLLTNTAGIEKLLTSAYTDFIMDDGQDQTGASFQGCVGFGMIFDCAGSDICCFENYGGSPEEIYKFSQSRTQSSGGSRRMWSKCYNIINQCNIILDNIDGASGDDAAKAAIKGQALAMRGWSYFYLVMNFQQTYSIAKEKRGVILRLHADDPASMGFSTVEETYKQIVSDLTSAKSSLAGFKRGDLWMVDKVVVAGMLARVYQVMENWSECLKEATEAYNAFPTLMDKNQWYCGFDTLYEDGCPELIWSAHFTNTDHISSNTPFHFWYNYDPSYGEQQMAASVYNFLNMLVTQSYVDLFANDPDDYRGFQNAKAGITDSEEQQVMFWHRSHPAVSDKWAYNKLKSYGLYHDAATSNGATGASNYDISYPLMRSSEMLLIMAEAAEHTSNNGAQYLNKLRTARGAKAVSSDILEEIYRERRRELLGEGITGSYDLLRLKKDLVRTVADGEHFSYGVTYLDKQGGNTYVLKSNDYRFICQIPELEIANNEAIDASCQNPYSGQ